MVKNEVKSLHIVYLVLCLACEYLLLYKREMTKKESNWCVSVCVCVKPVLEHPLFTLPHLH